MKAYSRNILYIMQCVQLEFLLFCLNIKEVVTYFLASNNYTLSKEMFKIASRKIK